MLVKYQTRLFTHRPAGKTFFQASSAVGSKEQNDYDAVGDCCGTVLRRHLGGLGAFTRRHSLK